MAGELAKLRQDLENFWASKSAEIKKTYRSAIHRAYAGDNYASCLKEAARQGVEYSKAAEDCAKKYGVAKKLAELWGSS